MAINLYTQSQVQIALQRASVALLLISQKIASQFMYLQPYLYNTYKDLQYDIYNLYTTVNDELPYQQFTATPNTYEQSYYALVGAMIEKTKTVDVFGAYDGASNINYQAPGTTVNIVNPIFWLPSQDIYYNEFDPTTQQSDGGRYIWYNGNIKGYNPVIYVNSPAATRLFAGTDYSLLPTGGIQLLPGGNFPYIYPGGVLNITGYEAS